MKRRITELVARIQHDYDHFVWSEKFENPEGSTRFLFIRFIILNINHALWTLVCRFKGHDWDIDSVGGPEGGYESGYCKRCGEGFHNRLY